MSTSRPSDVSPSPKCLRICYWNIHGWSSKLVGNKLMDSEFLKKISDCDIVTLAELHCDEELTLPGFVSLKQKIRKKIAQRAQNRRGNWYLCKRSISAPGTSDTQR